MAKTESLEIIPKFAIKTKRFNPNVIHNPGMNDVIIEDDSIGQYLNPSVTDKEAYRVTLASMRGMIQNLGSSKVGSYSLKDGKYDPNLDFSFLNRKDLTIVDIDNFIKRMKESLDVYDGELKLKIQEALDKASELKEVKEKETVHSSEGSENSK